MKFKIEYTGKCENRLLTYISEEFSFDMEPVVKEIKFDLVINKLNLTVIEGNKLVQVWGYCGLADRMKSNIQVPESVKGTLKVIEELKQGIGSYRINQEELPVNINMQTGWVCVGNHEKDGNAVEFIDNCIAVIDKESNFVSLWLKPEELPSFL